MSNQEMSKHDHVLAGLMFSLQAAAMQQMGKIQDPVSGEVAVDLEQARSSIDVLEMLKAKCRTDTPDELLRMLDDAVLNLQLNYMDEVKKQQAAPEAGSEPDPEANPEAEATADAADETDAAGTDT